MFRLSQVCVFTVYLFSLKNYCFNQSIDTFKITTLPTVEVASDKQKYSYQILKGYLKRYIIADQKVQYVSIGPIEYYTKSKKSKNKNVKLDYKNIDLFIYQEPPLPESQQKRTISISFSPNVRVPTMYHNGQLSYFLNQFDLDTTNNNIIVKKN